MYRKQCRKEFFTKYIFGGQKKKEKKKKKKNYAKKRRFVCFLAVKYFCQIPHQKFSVLSFFIKCIALRYAENNPQKYFQPSPYFRGQHLAKIKELWKKRFLPWNVFIEVLLQKLLSFLLFFIVDKVLNVQKNPKTTTSQYAFFGGPQNLDFF